MGLGSVAEREERSGATTEKRIPSANPLLLQEIDSRLQERDSLFRKHRKELVDLGCGDLGGTKQGRASNVTRIESKHVLSYVIEGRAKCRGSWI